MFLYALKLLSVLTPLHYGKASIASAHEIVNLNRNNTFMLRGGDFWLELGVVITRSIWEAFFFFFPRRDHAGPQGTS